MQICSVCQLEKDDDCFRASVNKDTSIIYLRKQCKQCESMAQQIRRKENIEYYITYNRQYKADNKEGLSLANKQYNLEHTEEKSVYNAQYFQDNKDELSIYQNIHKKNRRATNPQYKLRCNISASINKMLKRHNSSKSGKGIKEYLPYTIQELKEHLESLFESWMTWANWGIYNPQTWNDDDPATWTWNIDHIIPQAKLIYNSIEDDNFNLCWALNNLRPYSAKQNRLDGDKRS